jgi:hypothetical protein
MKANEAKKNKPFLQKIIGLVEKITLFVLRQFVLPYMPKQIVFDVVVGILLPLFILIIDPIVFKVGWMLDDSWWYGAILGRMRVFAYTLIGAGFITLLFSLFMQEKLPPFIKAAFFGFFVLGANIALAIGFFLLLMTAPMIMAMLFSIRDLVTLSPEDDAIFYVILAAFFSGLSMLPTAFVYARNSLRAIILALRDLKWYQLFLSMLIGVMVILLIPTLVQVGTEVYVNIMVEQLISGTDKINMQAVQAMKLAFWCERWCYRDLFDAYQAAEKPEDRARLLEVYYRLTGGDLSEDTMIFED